jgi:hypothetical protein
VPRKPGVLTVEIAYPDRRGAVPGVGGVGGDPQDHLGIGARPA